VYFSPEDSIPVVFDTGATISVSPHYDDFISWEQSAHDLTLNGITTRTQVKGAGVVEWTIRDDKGTRHKIRTRAYYVPEAQVRL
jgi:hypothetical protein